MGRSYAGVLGLIAFITTLVHGLLHQRGAESILLAACGAMAVFAVIGGLAGRVAAATVEASVQRQIAEQLAASGDRSTPKPDNHAGQRGSAAT